MQRSNAATQQHNAATQRRNAAMQQHSNVMKKCNAEMQQRNNATQQRNAAIQRSNAMQQHSNATQQHNAICCFSGCWVEADRPSLHRLHYFVCSCTHFIFTFVLWNTKTPLRNVSKECCCCCSPLLLELSSFLFWSVWLCFCHVDQLEPQTQPDNFIGSGGFQNNISPTTRNRSYILGVTSFPFQLFCS